jgi:putative transposase
MKGRKFPPEQIIRIIKESELGVKNIDICRKYGISEQTFYNWKNKYGGMEISDAMKLKGLEDENRVSLKTTEIYIHVMAREIRGLKSSLDRL